MVGAGIQASAQRRIRVGNPPAPPAVGLPRGVNILAWPDLALTKLLDEGRQLAGSRLKDEPTTLEELSGEYGISRERVRQIEVRAFAKLQRAIKALEAEQAANSVAALQAPQESGRQPHA